jgi:hypothetical protein
MTARDTGHLFTRKNSTSPNAVTSERIAADLNAFEQAGGKVEVLGVTHTLKKLDGASPQASNAPARASSGARRPAKS